MFASAHTTFRVFRHESVTNPKKEIVFTDESLTPRFIFPQVDFGGIGVLNSHVKSVKRLFAGTKHFPSNVAHDPTSDKAREGLKS